MGREITTTEAADLLAVSTRRVLAMQRQGHFTAVRYVGRQPLYRLAEIERFRRQRIAAGIQADSAPN